MSFYFSPMCAFSLMALLPCKCLVLVRVGAILEERGVLISLLARLVVVVLDHRSPRERSKRERLRVQPEITTTTRRKYVEQYNYTIQA